jgi:hypothetical protein
MIVNPKFSISLSEIHDEICHRGWEIIKCKYDKKTDRYTAHAKNELDQEVEAFGKNPKQALANLLNNVAYEHAKGIQRLARWKQTFEGQLLQIAEAYSKAPAYEKKAAAAFLELSAECESRAKVIRQHIQVTTVNNPEPYPTSDKMYDDVRKRRKLEVSAVAADNHPIWTREQVVDYRICIDVLGFTAANANWGWEGTNYAFGAFAALLPELAQEALFSELVGQTAYATYYRAYGPAKICLLTKFIEKAMREENPHRGFRGIHPSQMLLPSETPEAKQKTAGIAKKTKPNADGSMPFDINDGWSSTLENIPTVHYPTEFSDFFNLRGASDVLDGLHTDWAETIHDNSDSAHIRQEWRTYKLDDPEGALRIKHAVANAIKGALLLEDNTLGHGAVQYQALLHKVSDDPEELIKTLNGARSEWNVERFGEHTSEEHRPWAIADAKSGQIPMFALANLIYEKNPDMKLMDAHKEAQRTIHQMLSRFHEQAKAEENTDNIPKDEAGWQTESKAIEKLMKWLDITTGSHGKFDHWMVPGQHVSAIDPIKPHKYDPGYDQYDNHKVFNLQRFPAIHGKHIQTISKLIKSLDQIVEEALIDVHNHDGKGHHFRAFIMHLVDIDPKTVGVMWLLLAPYTSQLSMIDEEMAGALGHHAEGRAARNYFLHERELIAHRDGMGLAHIPLGHFNLALKGGHVAGGSKQSSENDKHDHQDLSSLRIENPTPAWKVKLKSPGDLLYNFSLTPDVVKPIQEHWNNTVATQFAPDETPTKSHRPGFMMIATNPIERKMASKMQEYRNLGMSVQDVWNKIDEPSDIIDKWTKNTNDLTQKNLSNSWKTAAEIWESSPITPNGHTIAHIENAPSINSTQAPYLMTSGSTNLSNGYVSAVHPTWLNQWIQHNGPYLTHYTPNPNTVQDIYRNGLIPASQLDQDQKFYSGKLTSRPDHVYLQGSIPAPNFSNNYVAVDLRKLDPSNLNPDEDSLLHTNHPFDDIPYGNGRTPVNFPYQSYGHWAHQYNLAHPKHTSWSLNSIGTVAHQGMITPDQLTPMAQVYTDLQQNWPHVLSNYGPTHRVPYNSRWDDLGTKESAQPGWTDFYHATPRANRESIQNLGLMGENGSSPWGDTTRSWGQPYGNYFFDNPNDAVTYANSAYNRFKRDGADDYERQYTQAEPPQGWGNLNDDEYDQWHEDNPPTQRTEDPEGWDVWKVNTRGLNINRDPEANLVSPRSPQDIHPDMNNSDAPWDEQLEDAINMYGGSPNRYYTQDHIEPERVQLHQHIPMWQNHDDDEYEYEYEYETHHPMHWDEALLHRPKFPAHSSIKTADKLHDFLMNPKSRPDTNLNPHWNPDTHKYENELYQSSPQSVPQQLPQPIQPVPGGAWS